MRVFSWTHQATHWLRQGLLAGHEGFWLGLLDHQQLQLAAALHYGELWKKYREPGYNRSGLQGWERAALQAHFSGCRTLLLGAAGGGRELLQLCQLGYEVVAFDCVPALVQESSRLLADQGLRAQVLQAEPDALPQGLGTFDGAVMGWGGYMHIMGQRRRVAFLRQLGRHLQPGAPLLLSFYVREPADRLLPWIRALGNGLRALRGDPERLELGDTLSGTFDHLFSEAELRQELALAGFDTVHFCREPYAHAVGRRR